MVRLKNTTGFRNVDDMVSPEHNAGNYIGMINNRPIIIDKDDVKRSLNTLYTMDNCLNQCQNNFIEPSGFVIGGTTFTVDANTYDEITLDEPMTKSIIGLFERGDGNGCKDNSYMTWNQPVMDDVETDLGKCHQTLGTNVQPAYWAMNGIFNDANDGWKSSSEVSQWTFESKIPFIISSIVFTNTTDNYKTRLLNISTDNKQLFKEYYVNKDNIGKSYISIDSKVRDESNVLNIKTLMSFYNQGVGFNEIVINAQTRYIQQDTEYKVFVIEDEDGNVDVLASSYDEPELPEGFIKYAFVKTIRTMYNKIQFASEYGDTLIFHTEKYPAVITKNGTITYLYNIQPLSVTWNDALPTKYYVYVDENGNTSASTQLVNDIILCEITCQKGYIINVKQYFCNDNGLFRYNESTLKIIETQVIQNYNYDIVADDLSNITSVDCVLKCMRANNGYEVGAILNTDFSPTISGNHILLTTSSISISVKGTSVSEIINPSEWKLVFRLKR